MQGFPGPYRSGVTPGNYTNASISVDESGNVTAAANGTVVTTGDAGKRYRFVGGVIRNSGAGWAFISDANHAPVGMTGALTVLAAPEDYKLVVPYSFTGTRVATLVACPDETFAAYGMCVGASVGDDECVLYASLPLRFRTFGASAVGDVHTFFGSRVSIAANVAGTGYIATVPTMGTTAISQPQATIRAVDARSVNVRVLPIGSTSFEVVCYSQLQGRCTYNGSTWDFITNNVCGLSAAFASNQLTITHNTSGLATLGAMVSRLDGKYEPRIVSRSANTLVIKFYDATGTLVTAADTSMSVEFSRPHEFPALIPANQGVSLDCGPAFLYWNDIVSAGGNIWLYGLMEN